MNAQNNHKRIEKNVSKSENVNAIEQALKLLEEEEAKKLALIEEEEKKLLARRAKTQKNKREFERFYTNAQFLSQSYLIEAALTYEVCANKLTMIETLADLCECSRERVLQHLSHLKRENNAKFTLNATKQVLKSFECDRITK